MSSYSHLLVASLRRCCCSHVAVSAYQAPLQERRDGCESSTMIYSSCTTRLVRTAVLFGVMTPSRCRIVTAVRQVPKKRMSDE